MQNSTSSPVVLFIAQGLVQQEADLSKWRTANSEIRYGKGHLMALIYLPS